MTQDMNQNMINDKEQRIERIGNSFITSCFKVHALRYAFVLVMMTFGGGVNGAWGQQSPVEITTADDIANNTKKLYLIQTNAFPSFYIAPQANNTITTNNILGDYMLWYFLNAGTDDDHQYYYIVSYTENKYVCHGGGTANSNTQRGVTLVEKNSDNEERCKFYIELNETNGTTGFYNIDAKGKPTYYGLNKRGASEANTNPIMVTNKDYINDINSKWKFIPYNGTFTWPTPPFELSTDIDKQYYKIRNVQENTYYVSTDATPDKVTYSNTESNSMVWYFKEAPNDPSTPWFKYYYIVNPKADNKYMYYSGTAIDGSNQTNVISVEDYDSNDDNRFQFVVVQAARGDGNSRVTCYAIIPKLLRDNYWTSNSIGSTSISNGTKMGIISSRSTGNPLKCNAHWQFVTTSYPLKCVAPTITYSSATGKITIASTTSENTIYYTTDGETEPSSSAGTPYSAPFDVSGPITIKAIATKTGFDDSEVTTKSFEQVATPYIQDNGSNAISITCATEGATIYYSTDGSTPSTEYTGPLTENVSGVTIKAIAKKDGMINSTVESRAVTLRCAKPVIAKSGGNVTISCNFPASGVSIHYTKNGGNPTSSSDLYSGAIPVSEGDVIKAIAIATDYNDSEVATKTIRTDLTPTDGKYLINNSTDFEIFVDMASEADGAGNHYVLKTDVDASTVAAITQPFTGTLEVAVDAEGNFYKISGLTHALFDAINDGIVKNVVLDGVNITTGTNIGAICNEADGATKIYNCGVLSGSVKGGTNVGGLVGLIKSGSSVRVVNCYSYANVSGSSYAAGIVGKNEGTVGNVRIALCMMYGSVSGATNISPVYGGEHTNNVQNFTEYNYYLYSNERDAIGNRIEKIPYTAYNDQLAIDKDDYLTRFPFYRHILNTHRELAAYFLFGPTANGVSDLTNAQISEIGHWAIDKSLTNNPYPIVEKWETNTKKVLDAPAGTLADVRVGDGAPITSLPVTVKIGNTTYNKSLPITAMDEANHDYTWGKVVLPFANEFEVNSDYTQICTGWKITNIYDGTTGTFSNYNVSDRNCTAKDLFSNTGFIFAQGGYFIVPYNVTGIEITANFATAFYLSDATYDVGYDANYANPTGLGGSTKNTFNGQTVYNNIVDALEVMSAASTPHSQAIVLVGNYHFPTAIPANKDTNPISGYTGKAFTLMSIDADNNQEPDYAWYSNNSLDRPAIAPVRFDFIAQIPLGMAANVTGSKGFPGIPIWRPRGWLEMTETSLSLINQFELNDGDFTANSSINNRCIINGGYFTQMVRARNKAANKLSYFQIGGKAYVKEFYPGNHSAANHAVTLAPVNVTGGEIEECFMTGYGKGTAIGNNIYFWCSGGKIGKFLGAYMEKPKQTTSSDGNVNLTAMIDHAKIGRFFGGGTSPKAPITGNINITINNSTVDFYCGGPEFGNMSSGKTVTTNATNTTFEKYYGAGFGGTSITYNNDKDDGNVDFSGDTKTYPGYFTTYYLSQSTGRLKKTEKGICSCYKFEYIYHSYNPCGVARFYTGYAKFDLATTGSVINNLNGCTINGDFYGAGCQGMVSGTVSSTLNDCTINGSAYGGGFKATANEVDVYPETQPSLSVFTKETGLFSEFGTVSPETYTWIQGDASHDEVAGTGANSGKLYTSKDINMSALGNVTEAISITVNGGSVTGSVFGGGNESKSLNNTTVNLQGNAIIDGNVYGGGNKAEVSGSTTVNIKE